jgi:REP element-mobilizing transposase RayT
LEEKEENFFHITWVTHNSRVSERMKKYKVRSGKPLYLSSSEEAEIAAYISEIADSDDLKIFMFNICRDHVHMLLMCENTERDNIVRKLKSVSARKFFQKERELSRVEGHGGLPPCDKINRLWAQKYNWSVLTDDNSIGNVYEYIKFNREKHSLPFNRRLKEVIEKMLTPFEDMG